MGIAHSSMLADCARPCSGDHVLSSLSSLSGPPLIFHVGGLSMGRSLRYCVNDDRSAHQSEAQQLSPRSGEVGNHGSKVNCAPQLMPFFLALLFVAGIRLCSSSFPFFSLLLVSLVQQSEAECWPE